MRKNLNQLQAEIIGGDGVSVKVKVSYESGKDLERLKREAP